ncbi:MAG: transposase [Bdellovibrionota bacterium]
MSRKKFVKSDFLPYHITARANRREAFPVPLEIAWKIFAENCYEIQICHGVEIHAFVMMSNHIHLILTSPNEDLGKVMHRFFWSASRTMNSISGHINHLFGGPYHRTLIDSSLYFRHAVKYVYRNPVKAGICNQVQDYPFSSLLGLIGSSRAEFPLHIPRCGFGLEPSFHNYEKLVDWLNRPYSSETDHAIRYALQKTEFQLPKTGSYRTRYVLPED